MTLATFCACFILGWPGALDRKHEVHTFKALGKVRFPLIANAFGVTGGGGAIFP